MASGGNTADHRIKIEISVQAQSFIDLLGCTQERCRLIAATAMEMAAGKLAAGQLAPGTAAPIKGAALERRWPGR